MQKFLKRSKYFGFRFLYYRILDRFPWVHQRLLDLISPQLTSRYKSQQLITIFNGKQGQGANLAKQDFIGLGLIHYSIIRMLRPQRVLCVGSLRGFVPAICALACQDNHKGSVDFVDAGFDSDDRRSWGADGFWRKYNPQTHFFEMGIRKIKTYVVTNTEFAKKFPDRKYEYIYIDGDHTYEGVNLDYKLFWPRLKKGGFMLFHDIHGQGKIGGSEFGVKKFWAEIEDKQKIEIPFPKPSGLGILQK